MPFKPLSASTLLLAVIALLNTTSRAPAQQDLPVRVDRWLEVEQLSGAVTCILGGVSQTAQLSNRLQQVGDTLITGRSSSAVLVVDTGVGTINVSENTTIRVQTLDINPDGGRITRLQVTGGQVRLRVRPFTHPSQLEIQTPAGSSGVRGTEFGVSVQPSGNTGVATLEGSVFAAAQGEEVTVATEQQSLVIPGEPPTPPEPLRDDPSLDIRTLTRINAQTLQIVGRVDPVNLLQVDGEPQVVDRTGIFNVQFSRTADRQVTITVTTPLGTRRLYEVTTP